ncbi:MAG: phage portal protein [Methylibium sp.]|nr:phage portal protein [Methylibium sp.]
MFSRLVDAAVAAIAPRAAVRRSVARQMLDRLGGRRGYAAARHGNHVWDRFRSGNLSANSELSGDLPTLRARSRTLYQDTATAHAAVEAMVALIVGTGIDIEPQSGIPEADRRLHDVWLQWAERPTACGGMTLWELELQAVRSMALNGEALFQIVHLPDATRPIPFALHPIESDQLALDPVADIPAGHRFAAGVEVDAFMRPVAYHVLNAHPGDTSARGYQVGVNGSTLHPGNSVTADASAPGGRGGNGRRIPADQIIHVYKRLRPGQTRGVPWLAPVMGTLHQEAQLVESELTSAKLGASLSLFIAMEGGLGHQAMASGEDGSDGQMPVRRFEPGSIIEGAPGESATVIQNGRPSQQISPFRQMLRGDIAAALGIRQTDLDRDYSRANYSSMRAAQLDLARTIKPLQDAIGAQFIGQVYLRALPQLAVSADVVLPRDQAAMRRVSRYQLMPDGFAYVDPEKDVKAAILAIRSGLSTWKDELGQRGKEGRQVHQQLLVELRDPLLARIHADAPPAPVQPAQEAVHAA